jgi:hypothetical protein
MPDEEFKLSIALSALNTLIDQGWEFPDALFKTTESFAVSRAALTEAYDAQ